jgi:hypothetical protein
MQRRKKLYVIVTGNAICCQAVQSTLTKLSSGSFIDVPGNSLQRVAERTLRHFFTYVQTEMMLNTALTTADFRVIK